MATTRIKDISKTTTDLASDTYGVFDGSTNGTQKMSRDDMYADWAAAYVAAPTTYKLAPLNSGTNKIDATYLPTSSDTPKGEWDANANSPALADGSGTAGDYYDVTTAGTQDLGSGSIAYTVGDVVKYNGSTWYKIDSVANILDGSATAADGRSTLSVNSIDEDAQANGTKVMAPALYFNGSSSVVTVADDDKLTFSTLTEFGKTTAGTWSPEDNTPALTDGTGTLNDHYKIDADGTVAQGGSTLSIIDGASVTAGQVVYYDGSVWRVKDCDDLPFTVSAFIKMTDATLFSIVGKYTGTSSEREWLFWVNGSDKLNFFVQDNASGNSEGQESTAALTSYEGQWIHVAASYGGSGSSSASSYSAASDEITIFVNGEAVAMTDVSGGTYTGMANGGGAMWVGRASSSYAKGSIRDVKIFNRELTASEVAELARGNDLGFADEFGGAEVYTGDSSTFTSSLGNWTTEGAGITVTQSGGAMVVTNTAASTGTRGARNIVDTLTEGKRYRCTFTCQTTSGTGQQIQLTTFNASVTTDKNVLYGSGMTAGSAGSAVIAQFTPTGTNEQYSVEFVIEGGATESLFFKLNNTGAGEVYNIDSITLTEIGTLADFRAERYDTSTNKLYDLSDNAFVGTGTSVTLTGREVPVYETGTWTPTLIGSTTSDFTYSLQEGFYTRIGDLCYVNGIVSISNLGTSAGTITIGGLPFTSLNASGQQMPATIGYASGMTGLTSSLSAAFGDTSTSISLWKWAATGVSSLIETDMTNSADIRFGGIYKIQ